MKRRLSIGSWAYLFNQEKPTEDFHQVVHMLADIGYDGVELGGFKPHPNPDSCDTREKRQALRKLVKDHGLEFSGLAADLWSQKLISVEDSGPYIAAFAKNLFFAEDLGIKTIRVDTVEPISVMKEKNLDPLSGHGPRCPRLRFVLPSSRLIAASTCVGSSNQASRSTNRRRFSSWFAGSATTA